MTKSNVGRKTVMTPETLRKLEEAFKLGCTDEEACLNADIAMSTLYLYQSENSKYVERKKLLKKTPTFRARKCVVRDLESNSTIAIKYLERKEKKEFSPKSELAVTGLNVNDLLSGLSPELAEAVKDMLKTKMGNGEDE